MASFSEWSAFLSVSLRTGRFAYSKMLMRLFTYSHEKTRYWCSAHSASFSRPSAEDETNIALRQLSVRRTVFPSSFLTHATISPFLPG